MFVYVCERECRHFRFRGACQSAPEITRTALLSSALFRTVCITLINRFNRNLDVCESIQIRSCPNYDASNNRKFPQLLTNTSVNVFTLSYSYFNTVGSSKLTLANTCEVSKVLYTSVSVYFLHLGLVISTL